MELKDMGDQVHHIWHLFRSLREVIKKPSHTCVRHRPQLLSFWDKRRDSELSAYNCINQWSQACSKQSVIAWMMSWGGKSPIATKRPGGRGRPTSAGSSAEIVHHAPRPTFRRLHDEGQVRVTGDCAPVIQPHIESQASSRMDYRFTLKLVFIPIQSKQAYPT